MRKAVNRYQSLDNRLLLIRLASEHEKRRARLGAHQFPSHREQLRTALARKAFLESLARRR